MKFWCSTHAQTPRKHAHAEATNDPRLYTTRKSDTFPAEITAVWNCEGLSAMMSLDREALVEMLATLDREQPPGPPICSGCGKTVHPYRECGQKFVRGD